jgi:uncharacterized membrane protein YhaH (DUF805 family)
MNHYINVLKKYAVFSGRSSRAEYWYFLLFNFIVSLGLGFVEGFLDFFNDTNQSVFGNIYSLAILLPSIAVAVRRMHDVNKSGWYSLVPIYNLILAATEGSKGKNNYGPKPKQ